LAEEHIILMLFHWVYRTGMYSKEIDSPISLHSSVT